MNWFDNRAVDLCPANTDASRPIASTFWPQVKRVSSWACILPAPIFVFIFGYLSADEFRLLRDAGVETTGTVESRWVGSDDDQWTTYHVNYVFNAAGYSQRNQITVTNSEYIQLHSGEPITITYLPSDPRINCYGSPGDHVNDRIWLTLIVAVLIALFSAERMISSRRVWLKTPGGTS